MHVPVEVVDRAARALTYSGADTLVSVGGGSTIGLCKALGARASAIRTQFLLEAVILCNIGGVFGVVIGFGLGNLVAVFTDFEPRVPLEWAVIGLVFCSVIGVAFGTLPAIRASRLDGEESAQRFGG